MLGFALTTPVESLASTGSQAPDGWSYESEVADRLGEMPSDPVLASMALVDLIFEADDRTADYAVMEVLRRSGVPVINMLGGVAGLPDHLIFFDSAFYGELAPLVARSVVEGDFYTLDDFNDVFVSGGLLDEPLSHEQFMTVLGGWGRESDQVPEVQTAATAIRALGSRRGIVYWTGAPAEDARLDLLQLVLLISVLGSPASEPRDQPSGVRSQQKGPCQLFLETYQQNEVENSIFSAVAQKAFFALLGPIGAAIEGAKTLTDLATQISTTLVWANNIKLDLTADPGATHFRHAAGDDRGVLVTATAKWVGDTTPEEAACWQSLSNLKAFPTGGLPGFRVRFSISQPQSAARNGGLLRPVAGQAMAFNPGGSGGVVTDGSGEARVYLEPPIEDKPPPPPRPEATQQATVTARLDKDDFPFAIASMIDAGGLKTGPKLVSNGAYTFLFQRIVDIITSATQRMVLPNMQVEIPVTFHGRDVLYIEAATPLFLLYVSADFEANVYTCQGLQGTWYGKGGLNFADREFMGDILNDIGGAAGAGEIPSDFVIGLNPIDEYLDLTSGTDYLELGGAVFGLRVEIDPNLMNRGPGKVGTAHLVDVTHLDLAPISAILLALGGRLSWPVRRFDPDSPEAEALCPEEGGSHW